MNKSELVSVVAERTGRQKTVVDEILKETIATIVKTLRKKQPVRLHGFGTFKLKKRSARQATHPRTGKAILVPLRVRPQFVPAGVFRNYIESAFAVEIVQSRIDIAREARANAIAQSVVRGDVS